jgi:hypothetical protein
VRNYTLVRTGGKVRTGGEVSSLQKISAASDTTISNYPLKKQTRCAVPRLEAALVAAVEAGDLDRVDTAAGRNHTRSRGLRDPALVLHGRYPIRTMILPPVLIVAVNF